MTLWTISLGKPVFSTPAVHANHLYVACVDSTLYCLSSTTGDQVGVLIAKGCHDNPVNEVCVRMLVCVCGFYYILLPHSEVRGVHSESL